jgi:hypothetical protein
MNLTINTRYVIVTSLSTINTRYIIVTSLSTINTRDVIVTSLSTINTRYIIFCFPGDPQVVNVLYIDYGNAEKRDITHLRQLPTMFTALPAQAIYCALAKV